MSADNCIVIARFPKEEGFEWRVTYAMAIENCDDYDMKPDGTIEYWPKEFIDATRFMYFGKAPSYNEEKEASKAAVEIYDEMVKNGDIVEYGIISTCYDRPMRNWTEKEAVEVINAFWDSRNDKNG